MASAIMSPTKESEFADIVPTWAISLLSEHGFEISFNFSTVATTALSMPRFKSIGFIPAATDFIPSRTIACANTVAVVVPSPAISEVWEATSFTICAPIFSYLSFNSISFATDTPSLVTVGAPNDLSRTTFLPFGPSVAFTALANRSTPLFILCLASSPNFTSFAAILFHLYIN